MTTNSKSSSTSTTTTITNYDQYVTNMFHLYIPVQNHPQLKFGKPRRRHAWVVFELGLRNLELPHLLIRLTFAQLHFLHSTQPQASGPPWPSRLQCCDGSRPLLPSAGTTSSYVRTRKETSTTKRPSAASRGPVPKARIGSRLNLGVASASDGHPFGRTPCVTPTEGPNPGSTGQTGLKSLCYPTHSHASESLHFGSQ